jgi:hypothetical protein
MTNDNDNKLTDVFVPWQIDIIKQQIAEQRAAGRITRGDR